MVFLDPFLLLLWIVIISFIPGALLGITLFKRTELSLLEKILTGFALGFVLLPSIPFVLFLAGISYSYTIGLLSVVLLYAAAIGIFLYTKAYKELKIDVSLSDVGGIKRFVLPLLLLLVVFLTFWVRLQPYSPIHYELDPYYYIYTGQQILALGGPPLDDKTAWWPEVTVSHRTAPLLAYTEALWYSFYTGGDEYDNYLYAAITSIYPPLAAAFAVFFLYLFIAAQYRREFALIGATLAAFMPIFILKLSAGEMEVQPYAFFALTFFLAAYAWAMRSRLNELALLAGIGYAALALGSASEVLGTVVLLVFIPLHSILIFFKEKNEELKKFILLNGIVIVIGPIVGSTLLGWAFTGYLSFSRLIGLGGVLAFSAVLWVLNEKLKDREILSYGLVGLLALSILAAIFTPLGEYAKGIAIGGLSIAKYNVPLHRTIAEQPPAGATFSSHLGFMALLPSEIKELSEILGALLAPFSFSTNVILSSVYSILNATLGVGLIYDFKENSLILLLIFFAFTALLYSIYRSVKEKPTLFLLYAAIFIPTLLIGILKLKYTIYMGFFLAGMFGLTLGEAEHAAGTIARILMKKESKKAALYIFFALLLIGALFAVLQFSHNGFVPSVLSSSLKTRFQDNPLALKTKLSAICSQLSMAGIDERQLCSVYGFCSASDENVCTVAQDPVKYANSGINAQYNRKLCYYSLIGDLLNPKNEELIAAQFRCTPISDYWIESMEWIKNNTEEGSRITSWWDYGHWINFFGQRNTVLRNEHASLSMIGAVAKGYLNDSPEELAAWMKAHGSRYALFDIEINGIHGGKYHALNYLSCAYMNETDVTKKQLQSLCEHEHLWETLYIPKNAADQKCTISVTENKSGILVYTMKAEQKGGIAQTSIAPTYCAGEAMLADGQKIIATYYLDKKYPNGDLKLNKAILQKSGEVENAHVYVAYYTNDPIWLENGEIKTGWEDRKGKYYDSNVYRAFFLEELPGFDLVFKSRGGEVKIYKLRE